MILIDEDRAALACFMKHESRPEPIGGTIRKRFRKRRHGWTVTPPVEAGAGKGGESNV